MNTLPKSLKQLISEFESLPGIGPRSASRLAYFFLRAPSVRSQRLSECLSSLKENIRLCDTCYNYSDYDRCVVCSSDMRDKDILLIVEEPLDVLAFERMGKYKGVYHVLGGVISPVNGIGPEEIRLQELESRLRKDEFEEIIIATNPNLEGESTAIFIKKIIENIGSDLKITRIARGLPSGADLEYADETTLEKAIEGRVVF